MNLNIKGLTRNIHYSASGDVIKDSGWILNTVTNTGKAQIALLAGDASAVPFTYIAIGTSNTAPAATDTALIAESAATGLTRAAATVSRVTTSTTNDTLQLEKTFTNTSGGNVTIEEQGVFNDATVGVMLGRGLTTSKLLANNESLAVTHKFIFA